MSFKRLFNRKKFKAKDKIGKGVKVAVCIPSGTMIHADMAMDLVNMVAFSASYGVRIVLINQKSSIIEVGRCELVEQARKTEAHKILFLDSDMRFPAETLMALLTTGKDIICTNAARKTPPYTPVVTYCDGVDPDSEQISEIMGVATGICLVDMKVFDAIERPYFLVTYKEEGQKFLGEDYYFGLKAKEAGYKLFCHNELSYLIGHIGPHAFQLTKKKEEGSDESE